MTETEVPDAAAASGAGQLIQNAEDGGPGETARKPSCLDGLFDAFKGALALLSRGKRPESEREAEESEAPLKFSCRTQNGFRIEYAPNCGVRNGKETAYLFDVVDPGGISSSCTVLLPDYMKELVRARANREEFPGRDRFWQAICEEALTDYLLVHGRPPERGMLKVCDLSEKLLNWICSVLSGSAKNAD
jgi:hypothetical protein